MVSPVAVWWLVSWLLVGPAWGSPLPLQPESHPLSLVSDLSTRLGQHPSRLQDARLSLPSTQDLEAIKKVAQILVTLGQQVIPAIIGEPAPPGDCDSATGAGGDDVPNDPVNLNDRQA